MYLPATRNERMTAPSMGETSGVVKLNSSNMEYSLSEKYKPFNKIYYFTYAT